MTKEEIYSKKYIGKKYGKLTVLSYSHRKPCYLIDKKSLKKKIKKYSWFFNCICECGNKKTINIESLRRGLSTSCGCYIKEKRKNGLHIIHNLTNTRIYNIWCGMKSRCYYKKHKEFKYWGGKGIKVCDEWKNNFSNFYDWSINNGYKDNLSIDRIDGDKDYCPQNCRWATAKEQANNLKRPKHRHLSEKERERLSGFMKNNIYAAKYVIEFNGKLFGLKKFCDIFKKSYKKSLKEFKDMGNVDNIFGFNVNIKRVDKK